MKEITEFETKVPVPPTGMLKEVLNKFGTLGHDKHFFIYNKEDVYLKDEHDDIGYNNKILRVRSVESISFNIRYANKILTDDRIGYLEENDIVLFLSSFNNSNNEFKTKSYLTAKLKSVENGYENNIEREVSISDNNESINELFDVLGFRRKFLKRKFSISYELEFEPFNVEIVYVSKDRYDKNGVWYVEIETTKELQERMGTRLIWNADEYKNRICNIFQHLGLDPSTKDNRNWKDILGIESE